MWSLAGFSEVAAVTTMTEINALSDDIFKTSVDDLYIGKLNRIIGLSLAGHSTQHGYIISPSLRRFSRIYIHPYYSHAADARDHCFRLFNDRSRSPAILDPDEAINVLAQVSEVHTDWDNVAGVWLADGPIAPVTGDIRTVYATDTDLAIAQGSWAAGELEWTPDLPVGEYAIVGARAWTPHYALARFIFREETNRPGFITCWDGHFTADPEFRMGYLGVWGRFHSVAPPMIEATGAFASTGIYARVDLMKMG